MLPAPTPDPSFVFPADKLSPAMPIIVFAKGANKGMAGTIVQVKAGYVTAYLRDEDGRERHYRFCYHKNDPYWKTHPQNFQYPEHAMFDFTVDWVKQQQVYADVAALKAENADLRKGLATLAGEVLALREQRGSKLKVAA